MTRCLAPVQEDPDDTLPEGWDEWRTARECTHDPCIEAAYYAAMYRAERQHRESIAIARQDLDMPHASEDELQTAIYLGLK